MDELEVEAGEEAKAKEEAGSVFMAVIAAEEEAQEEAGSILMAMVEAKEEDEEKMTGRVRWGAVILRVAARANM